MISSPPQPCPLPIIVWCKRCRLGSQPGNYCEKCGHELKDAFQPIKGCVTSVNKPSKVMRRAKKDIKQRHGPGSEHAGRMKSTPLDDCSSKNISGSSSWFWGSVDPSSKENSNRLIEKCPSLNSVLPSLDEGLLNRPSNFSEKLKLQERLQDALAHALPNRFPRKLGQDVVIESRDKVSDVLPVQGSCVGLVWGADFETSEKLLQTQIRLMNMEIQAHQHRLNHILEMNLLEPLSSTLRHKQQQITSAIQSHVKKLQSLEEQLNRLKKTKKQSFEACRQVEKLRSAEQRERVLQTSAARCIQHFFQRILARKILSALAAKTFETIYDKETNRCFYYNRKTGKSTWDRPKALKKFDVDELSKPCLSSIMTLEDAAIIVQRNYRRHRATAYLFELLQSTYEKVFDPDTGSFFYHNANTGESSWSKPKLLRDKDDCLITEKTPQKIYIPKTPDEAATMLQRVYKTHQAKRRLRTLISNIYTRIYDQENDSYFYYNAKTGTSQWEKPKLLRNMEWS